MAWAQYVFSLNDVLGAPASRIPVLDVVFMGTELWDGKALLGRNCGTLLKEKVFLYATATNSGTTARAAYPVSLCCSPSRDFTLNTTLVCVNC